MNRIPRRTLLLGGASFAFGFGQSDPASARPREGDFLVKLDDRTLKPLTPEDIPQGVPTEAWALDPTDKTPRNGSRLNQILLIRLDAAQLSEDTKSRAVDGVVAYSGICTHEGCEVDDWIAKEQLLHCSCHFSRFDPKDDAKVVDGPASRKLPALPLRLESGRLAVAGPFNARVGSG